MKRTYTWAASLTDKEYLNLKQAGDIMMRSKDFTISIGVEPTDLLPERVQEDVKNFIGRSLAALHRLTLSNEVED